MNQIELNQQSRDLLERVRHKSKVLSLYDMPADLAEAAVWEIGRTLLGRMQLPLFVCQFNRTQGRRAEKYYANSARQPSDVTTILLPA